MIRRGLWLAVLALLSGCVVYVRSQRDEPLPLAALEDLAPGRSLADCLAALGAPNQVFEHAGDGAALLWSWSDTDDWSVDVSVPVYEQASASFDLDLTDTDQRGLVLWFGPDQRLERWQRGTLGDLLLRRVRPAAIE